MQQVESRRPQTLLCLQVAASRCGGFPFHGKTPDRMVAPHKEMMGVSRGSGHVLSPSRNGLSAGDLGIPLLKDNLFHERLSFILNLIT